MTNEQAAERRAKHECLIGELVEALENVLGPEDDPNLGWRRQGMTSLDHFCCEYCSAEGLDCTDMPHASGCPIPTARAALARAKEQQQ